jgi:hypothetical protein
MQNEKPEDEEAQPWWRSAVSFWQFGIAIGAVVLLVLLAGNETWPFGTSPPPVRNEASIWEVILFDRLMIGFLRAGALAVIGYVIVSVPVLIVSRRWVKGLSASGLAADEARTADAAIEELQYELLATQEELQTQVEQMDMTNELLLGLQAEEECADNSPQEGD